MFWSATEPPSGQRRRGERGADDARVVVELRPATISVRSSMRGRNFSDFLLTPPPTMMSSRPEDGLDELEVRLAGACAHCFHERSSRSRTDSAAQSSASPPWCSGRCPSSVFGTSTPSTKTALPMPVPSVTTTTTPVAVAAGAELHLRDARGVGVVEHRDGTARRPFEQLDRVGADPRLVDVRGGPDDAALDDGRQRETDRARRVELGEEVLDDAGDGVGRRGRRRQEADPVGGERPGGEIDGRALDAGAADIDRRLARSEPADTSAMVGRYARCPAVASLHAGDRLGARNRPPPAVVSR